MENHNFMYVFPCVLSNALFLSYSLVYIGTRTVNKPHYNNHMFNKICMYFMWNKTSSSAASTSITFIWCMLLCFMHICRLYIQANAILFFICQDCQCIYKNVRGCLQDWTSGRHKVLWKLNIIILTDSSCNLLCSFTRFVAYPEKKITTILFFVNYIMKFVMCIPL